MADDGALTRHADPLNEAESVEALALTDSKMETEGGRPVHKQARRSSVWFGPHPPWHTNSPNHCRFVARSRRTQPNYQNTTELGGYVYSQNRQHPLPRGVAHVLQIRHTTPEVINLFVQQRALIFGDVEGIRAGARRVEVVHGHRCSVYTGGGHTTHLLQHVF